MNRIYLIMSVLIGSLIMISCKKSYDGDNCEYTYYQVGFKSKNIDWHDTAFVVRTKNSQLIQRANEQLSRPIAQRQIVAGRLEPSYGGYNKNASFTFKWQFKEDDWNLVDATAEIEDGRPYSDVDSDTAYWVNNVKWFGSWASYIKRKLPGKP